MHIFDRNILRFSILMADFVDIYWIEQIIIANKIYNNTSLDWFMTKEIRKESHWI